MGTHACPPPAQEGIGPPRTARRARLPCHPRTKPRTRGRAASRGPRGSDARPATRAGRRRGQDRDRLRVVRVVAMSIAPPRAVRRRHAHPVVGRHPDEPRVEERMELLRQEQPVLEMVAPWTEASLDVRRVEHGLRVPTGDRARSPVRVADARTERPLSLARHGLGGLPSPLVHVHESEARVELGLHRCVRGVPGNPREQRRGPTRVGLRLALHDARRPTLRRAPRDPGSARPEAGVAQHRAPEGS